MALVPSLLHTETPEKGCILLSYLNETVTVSASLESLRGNQSLFTDLVVEKDLFHCVSFTVSTICLSLFDTLYQIMVTGAGVESAKNNFKNVSELGHLEIGRAHV